MITAKYKSTSDENERPSARLTNFKLLGLHLAVSTAQ